MLGANVAWGLMAPVAKVVMAGGLFAPMLLAGSRMAGGAALFWLTSLFYPREHVPVRDLLQMAGAGMLGILFNQGSYILGVGFTSPGEASIITTTMPIWVMLLAWLILREPITPKKLGGIACGAAGALILVLSSASAFSAAAERPALGDMLVLTAQISYALYLTFYRDFIRRYSLVTLMKWMFTFAAIGVLPVAVPAYRATDFSVISTAQWCGVAYVVVVATYLAYICSMIGQKILKPTLVGMYNYFQPVVAVSVGIAMGLDHFTPLKAVAVVLVFAGVYLVNISKAKY